jgi:hypothetical protein
LIRTKVPDAEKWHRCKDICTNFVVYDINDLYHQFRKLQEEGNQTDLIDLVGVG